MLSYQILADAAVTIDVPAGLARSCEGALHLRPREIRELTLDEVGYLAELKIRVEEIRQKPRRRAFSPPQAPVSGFEGKGKGEVPPEPKPPVIDDEADVTPKVKKKK